VRVQPRQQLLQLWQATAEYSYDGEKWQWGGRQADNSISDAEQLLCLMYPASAVDGFKLDQPDQTAGDVLAALRALGDSVEIPKVLMRTIANYLDRYTGPDGVPTFAGGSRFQPRGQDEVLTPEQRQLDVVDSFSMSITLMLATLGFVKVFRGVARRKQLRDELDALETAASRRLTAALVGLLRSFTVQAFPADSAMGRTLCRTVNQTGLPQAVLEDELRRALREVRAGLLDLTLGSGGAEVLDNENDLFECGWSWGVLKDANVVPTDEAIAQPRGTAQARPFLYFTVIALDGIEDLSSTRTQILGLLNPEQQNLARSLQLRWELTQRYWAAIASFGTGRWPLEDIPWRTTDERESDYYSVLVSSVVVGALVRRRAVDSDLARIGEILRELAGRARVTRRALVDDVAVALHVPGVEQNLYGADELGPEVVWPVSDFSTALLKRSIGVAKVARGTELRNRLLDLSDEVWDHLALRRIEGGQAGGLWDDPSRVFEQVPPGYDQPSWYLTERVAECLVAAAEAVETEPLRSPGLIADSVDLLNEADHLFNQELLFGSSASGQAMRAELARLGSRLEHAREISKTRPGTAMAIALRALHEIDDLVSARERVTRSG
jgi:hypothetical protein